MKKNNQHIVNKLNMEINTTRKETAFRINNQLDSFLREQLLPKLEAIFDELSLPGQIRRFESVQLEFEMKHVKDFDFFAETFAEQIRTKLERVGDESPDYQSEQQKKEERGIKSDQSGREKKKPAQSPEYAGNDVISDELNRQNTFLYFLETGQLPWYASAELLDEFTHQENFDNALKDSAFVERLKKLFITHPESITRFVRQASKQTTELLIFRLWKLPGPPDIIHLKSGNPQLQALIYELIIARLINSGYPNSAEKWEKLHPAIKNSSGSEQHPFDDWLAKLLLETGFEEYNFDKWTGKKQILKRDDKEIEPKRQAVAGDEIYIKNAGLILIHPFLPELFKRANCLDENNRMRTENQDYAIHLLHFVCTGNEQPAEHELAFEKFLCGLPFNRPVFRNIELRETDKTECTDLLKSVIENWKALKNTSPDGLRQNFFVRNGKIDLRRSPVKLYIERNTIDILLEKLPWLVSAVKLPWMNDLIFVEW